MSKRISIWRHASNQLTFLGIPCLAYFPLFIFLFHARMWTLILSISIIIFFAILAKFGLTFKVLLQKILHKIRGNRIFSRPWYYRNRFRKYE